MGISASVAAPTASGVGHDQMAGKGKSTFTLIYRGGFRGGGFHGGGFRGGAIGYRGGFGRHYAFAGRPGLYRGYGMRRAYWGGAGWRRAGWYGGLGRGWGWRRAGWYGGLGRGWGWGWRRAGWYGGLGRGWGWRSRRLVWWLGRLGLARWRRACRLWVRQRKLLLELPRRRLRTWILQRKLIRLLRRLGLLEQPASLWTRIGCSKTLKSSNFSAFNRFRLEAASSNSRRDLQRDAPAPGFHLRRRSQQRGCSRAETARASSRAWLGTQSGTSFKASVASALPSFPMAISASTMPDASRPHAIRDHRVRCQWHC